MCRSTGVRGQKSAGRLSDKVSGEPGKMLLASPGFFVPAPDRRWSNEENTSEADPFAVSRHR